MRLGWPPTLLEPEPCRIRPAPIYMHQALERTQELEFIRHRMELAYTRHLELVYTRQHMFILEILIPRSLDILCLRTHR